MVKDRIAIFELTRTFSHTKSKMSLLKTSAQSRIFLLQLFISLQRHHKLLIGLAMGAQLVYSSL